MLGVTADGEVRTLLQFQRRYALHLRRVALLLCFTYHLLLLIPYLIVIVIHVLSHHVSALLQNNVHWRQLLTTTCCS